MANRTSLFFFILVFTVNHAENLNFYFSLHENHAINSSFIKSVHTQDVLSCGRACAAELNCNTANYLKAENKCDLSEERIEKSNSRQEPVAAILKGCLLIEKIKMVPSAQDTQNLSAPIVWMHFTPQWCTPQGRRLFGNEKASEEECKEKCKQGCLGVEWWEKSRSCFECADPSKRTGYTNTNDAGYPPHVFLKSDG